MVLVGLRGLGCGKMELLESCRGNQPRRSSQNTRHFAMHNHDIQAELGLNLTILYTIDLYQTIVHQQIIAHMSLKWRRHLRL